ncbi:hypothetical protein P8452_74042 [Trifolium repens]|nr:hypothetical protein P8452_74042 [Trifolium repens]
MCPKQYRTTFPSLTTLDLNNCSLKELSGNIDHFLTLEIFKGNQFQAVKNRFVRNCQKLTLTSASTTNTLEEINNLDYYRIYSNLKSLFEQLQSAEATEDFELPSVENVTELEILPSSSKIQMRPTPKAEHEYVENVPELAILPTNSKELLNEQSVGETDAIVKPSQLNNLKGLTSEKTEVANVSNILGTKNEPPIQVIAKDDEIIVSKTKPSPSITSPIASQFPSTPSKGDPSPKVEDLTSYLLVKRELEELISKNHLNYENLSLLTDFLVKNPSVRLKDTSLRYRYKGCAYNLLAELLKFLETHSLLEVSGSCHSEFLELLQDARYFGFDMEWLDGVERRALFPEIRVSPDALEKLLDSKKQVTKDVEDLRLKIDVLSQVAEDLKLRLTSSEAVLESIIQQGAVLSAPIGY